MAEALRAVVSCANVSDFILSVGPVFDMETQNMDQSNRTKAASDSATIWT